MNKPKDTSKKEIKGLGGWMILPITILIILTLSFFITLLENMSVTGSSTNDTLLIILFVLTIILIFAKFKIARYLMLSCFSVLTIMNIYTWITIYQLIITPRVAFGILLNFGMILYLTISKRAINTFVEKPKLM